VIRQGQGGPALVGPGRLLRDPQGAAAGRALAGFDA
jgi:hypothetical protein